MHASLILLDLDLTLGTNLCIEFDPNRVIIISSLHLVNPLLENVTMNWFVSFPQTLEAVVITTLANDVSVFERGILHCIGATRSRTPLGSLVDVDE
jgi:DNA-binding transcriptional regulator YbjK